MPTRLAFLSDEELQSFSLPNRARIANFRPSAQKNGNIARILHQILPILLMFKEIAHILLLTFSSEIENPRAKVTMNQQKSRKALQDTDVRASR